MGTKMAVVSFSFVNGSEVGIALFVDFSVEYVTVVEDVGVCGELVIDVADDVDDEVATGISDDVGVDGSAVTVDDVVCDVVTVLAVVGASVVGLCVVGITAAVLTVVVDDVADDVNVLVVDDVMASEVGDVVDGCVGVVFSGVVG